MLLTDLDLVKRAAFSQVKYHSHSLYSNSTNNIHKFKIQKMTCRKNCILEKTSKGIWFFLPMGIALLVNGSIFGSIMYTLYKIYGNMQQFQLKKKEGDTADK